MQLVPQVVPHVQREVGLLGELLWVVGTEGGGLGALRLWGVVVGSLFRDKMVWEGQQLQ